MTPRSRAARATEPAVGGLGHRVMQNQQRRGIRRRAEAAARRTAAPAR